MDEEYLSYKTKTTYFFKTNTGQAKTKTTFSRPRSRSLFLNTIKRLTQDLKKRSLAEKIKPVMPVLPSHAGIMPITEKKPAYITGFLSSFASSKIRILRSEIWLRTK